MKKPLISVVMPAYNAEEYLDESINSILNQTFKDFEFIIVNDCSKDNTKKIIERFRKKDKRIILLNNKKNLKVPLTRSRGLKIARGKYIAVMDADDIAIKNRLELQYSFMEKNKDTFLCGGSAIVMDEEGKTIGVFRKINDPEKVKRNLLKGNPMVHSSVMFRNTGEYFYREKFEDADEYDVYLRILSDGRKITNIPNFLVKFRLNKGSTSFKLGFERNFFPQKIKEFYLQRIKYGKDDYDNFDNTKFLSKMTKRYTFQDYLQAKIVAGFQAGYMKQVRRDIKELAKLQGLNKSLLMYYILSFIPIKLIYFLTRR
ncbi:MAG: glycosyltransferase family 2 protein [Candidatus Pacearchaeota archaeon]|nr:glycosyltransferase family 2 protein [Candidatus Pacearchaeota archaeon]